MKLKLYALIVPFDRLGDTPRWGVFGASFAAAWQYAITDIFTTALFLIVLSGMFDYLLGVRAAKLRRAYDSEIAHAGFLSKISGVGLMMLVRIAEQWMLSAGVVDTHGWIAAALTLSLFAVDLESIQAKREELGGRPIPALGSFTTMLHNLITRTPPSPKTDAH